MKKLVAILLCAILILSMVACSPTQTSESDESTATQPEETTQEVATEEAATAPTENASAEAGEEYNIVYITPQASNPYFLTIDAGCQDAADELGVKVTYMAPMTNDMQGQTTVVQAALVAKPDFVIIAPVDSEGMVGVCQEFLDEGIPMITVDRDFNRQDLRLCAISSDNYIGGQTAADLTNELLGGTGDVAYLGFNPGITSIDERYAGWNDNLALYPGLKLVGEQFETSDIQKLTAKANAMITSDSELKAIFACFTNATIAAATAVKENDLIDSINVVGFDASPDEIELLKDGSVDVLICQRAYDMGKLAVEYAVAYLNDGTLPPDEVHTEFVAITADNMDDPDIAKYVYRSAE